MSRWCSAWTAAITMHGVRIDGVDWESGIGLTCPQHRTLHNTTSGLFTCSTVVIPSPPGLWESGNPAPFAGFPSGVEKLFLLFHAAPFPQPFSPPASRANSSGVRFPGCCEDALRYTLAATVRSSPRLEQILKPAYVQALFPHPPLKLSTRPFCIGQPVECAPTQSSARYTRPENAGSSAPARYHNESPAAPALGDDPLQHPRHTSTREAGVHFQCQALPRIRVQHAQHPDRSPALHGVMHEVQRPFLIGLRCRLVVAVRCAHSVCASCAEYSIPPPDTPDARACDSPSLRLRCSKTCKRR